MDFLTRRRYHTPIRNKRRCSLVPNAIARHGGVLQFEVPRAKTMWGLDAGAWGRLRGLGSNSSASTRGDMGNVDVIDVKVRPLSEVLDDHGAPSEIDYLSLDVEGAEREVMASFPWRRYTISVLTVEQKSGQAGIGPVLRQHDYVHYGNLGGTDQLWLHRSTLEELQRRNASGRSGRWC